VTAGYTRMQTLLLAVLIAGVTAAGAGIAQDGAERVKLPAPSLKGSMTVEEALKQRRSVREFSTVALELAEVAQLLWAAQGATSPDGHRAAPSAGALYPLELYLVAGNVAGLPAGLYRYQSAAHELVRLSRGDLRQDLAAAARGQVSVRSAPAVLAIAGVYQRTAVKYGERAPRYVHIEVGHAAQNVYLQVQARGLATVIVGAFDDKRVQELLGLPGDQVPLALLPVGRR
jgi:SagB-type dehydrogenase family enzyme